MKIMFVNSICENPIQTNKFKMNLYEYECTSHICVVDCCFFFLSLNFKWCTDRNLQFAISVFCAHFIHFLCMGHYEIQLLSTIHRVDHKFYQYIPIIGILLISLGFVDCHFAVLIHIIIAILCVLHYTCCVIDCVIQSTKYAERKWLIPKHITCERYEFSYGWCIK